ncbi:protein JTB-like [Myzus persicae]|uniref:protein JTB-like n=1 Tax=Myzus persicae TaxID=13164 RepID=UPI000B939EB0|nr:protein JTB-like [Myzus persicae]
MVLESCSVKRLLLLIIFIGGITLLIFIKITSSSAFSGLNATIAAETSEGVKDHKNSSNKCWLREENTILKECHLCTDRLECINASYVETIECKISGLTHRSCNKPTIRTSEKEFWLFQGSQFVIAVISLSVIQYKKKQFHKKLMKRLQKQLDSVV